MILKVSGIIQWHHWHFYIILKAHEKEIWVIQSFNNKNIHRHTHTEECMAVVWQHNNFGTSINFDAFYTTNSFVCVCVVCRLRNKDSQSSSCHFCFSFFLKQSPKFLLKHKQRKISVVLLRAILYPIPVLLWKEKNNKGTYLISNFDWMWFHIVSFPGSHTAMTHYFITHTISHNHHHHYCFHHCAHKCLLFLLLLFV